MAGTRLAEIQFTAVFEKAFSYIVQDPTQIILIYILAQPQSLYTYLLPIMLWFCARIAFFAKKGLTELLLSVFPTSDWMKLIALYFIYIFRPNCLNMVFFYLNRNMPQTFMVDNRLTAYIKIWVVWSGCRNLKCLHFGIKELDCAMGHQGSVLPFSHWFLLTCLHESQTILGVTEDESAE